MRIFSVDGLTAAGLRIRGVEQLSTLIHDSLLELSLIPQQASSTLASLRDHTAGDLSASIDFPDAVISAPIPIPAKLTTKPKRAAWEDSHEAFTRGSSIEVIALQKGVQVQTVVSHLLDAFKLGKALNLKQVSSQASARGIGPPTMAHWQAFEGACSSIIGRNSLAQPWSSQLTELMSNVDTDIFPNLVGLFTPRQQRDAPGEVGSSSSSSSSSEKREFTAEEATLRAEWFLYGKWWQALRSCGYSPCAVDEAATHVNKKIKV